MGVSRVLVLYTNAPMNPTKAVVCRLEILMMPTCESLRGVQLQAAMLDAWANFLVSLLADCRADLKPIYEATRQHRQPGCTLFNGGLLRRALRQLA